MQHDTDLLAQLIAQKRQCLGRLQEMGGRQLDLVRAGELASLLDLLAVKQGMLAELQRIERGLDRFRGEDPDSRQWRSPDLRRRCADLLAECEALLGEIVKGEKESESLLTLRRDEAAQRLHGMHCAREARGAYHAASEPHGCQLDLRSET